LNKESELNVTWKPIRFVYKELNPT